MPNVAVGIGSGIGYFPVTDMRSLDKGDAANAMLGWSYTVTTFGAAYGGEVTFTGSVGINNNNPLSPDSATWITCGPSIGFGSPGVGLFGGASNSTRAFGHEMKY